jgi:hypothetical protein
VTMYGPHGQVFVLSCGHPKARYETSGCPLSGVNGPIADTDLKHSNVCFQRKRTIIQIISAATTAVMTAPRHQPFRRPVIHMGAVPRIFSRAKLSSIPFPSQPSSEQARSSVSKTPSTSSTYCQPARYYPPSVSA